MQCLCSQVEEPNKSLLTVFILTTLFAAFLKWE